MSELEGYKNETGTNLTILQNLECVFKEKNPNVGRNTQRSLEWFRSYVPRAYNKTRTARMYEDNKLWTNRMDIGSCYLFDYDPKFKETLPIYDTMPLVFPVSAYKAKDGMTIVVGLNMHYLTPQQRMIAFRALLKNRTTSKISKNTRLNMDWQVLKSMAESKFFKHAIHSYRMDHVRSVFVEVPPKSWELVLFLPLARWKNGNNKSAWKR